MRKWDVCGIFSAFKVCHCAYIIYLLFFPIHIFIIKFLYSKQYFSLCKRAIGREERQISFTRFYQRCNISARCSCCFVKIEVKITGFCSPSIGQVILAWLDMWVQLYYYYTPLFCYLLVVWKCLAETNII
jgi:hypothetical protein